MRVQVEIEKSSGDMVMIFDEDVGNATQVQRLHVIMDLVLALEKEMDEFVGAMETGRR